MSRAPKEGENPEALKQAMSALMERVREDVLAQERLLATESKAAERAARLLVLLKEARRRLENLENLENLEKNTGRHPDDPAATP